MLLVDGLAFRRLAHLDYLPLPGGDRAAREPWRTATAALVHAFGRDEIESLGDLAPLAAADPSKRNAIADLAATPGACPSTSSAGRLFDAVASLLGICHQISYEAQAAMALERAATGESLGGEIGLPYRIIDSEEKDSALRLDFAPAIRAIVEQVRSGTAAGPLARQFHATLATALADVVARLRDETGVGAVALSGGVFQNRLLANLLEQALDTRGFRVLTHHQVSPNDGGLALGQAWAGVLHLRGQQEDR